MNLLAALALVALVSDDACSARLEQLLAVYREYGLPLPPPDASLMAVPVGTAFWPDGQRADIRVRPLGIRPLTPELAARTNDFGERVAALKPDPVALAGYDYGDLWFAIQCHERGWEPLARAAFRKWLAKAERCAERQLAYDAWEHWLAELADGRTPLPLCAKYLHRAFPRTGIDDESGECAALLRSLDLAAVPTHSAPGSDDALIDALIEERDRPDESEPYQALARRGFEAVPALVAHLGDDRLTRFCNPLGLYRKEWGSFLRVRDVAHELLCEFAGVRLGDASDSASRTLAAGRWFADAQKLGEEEYLVGRVKQLTGQPVRVLLPLLFEKYPRRVPEVYRAVLDGQPSTYATGDRCAQALAEGPLPVEEKRKAFEFAAAHADAGHRLVGLRHLIDLDPRRGAELLVAALDALPADADASELRIAALAANVAESSAWESLARAVQRAGVGTRMELFALVADQVQPPPATRKYRLAFLASYLDDASDWDGRPRFSDRVAGTSVPSKMPAARVFALNEVRNWAAWKLVDALRMKEKPDRDWTAEQWAALREKVRARVKDELAK
jgi:hypothetical protein